MERKDDIVELKHYVIWSGGCDSTVLLNRVAKEHGRVHTIYIDHHQVLENKKKHEKARREKMLEHFKKLGYDIDDIIINIDSTGHIAFNGGLIQGYIWLTYILPYIESNSKVYFGYIKGDDSLSHIENFSNLFYYAAKVLNIENVELVYPLRYMPKYEVLSELHELKLYNKVWYCEMSDNGRVCGKCTPCVTHQMALMKLAFKDKEQWAMDIINQLDKLKRL